ncbi:MAG: hypothetical protein DRR42_19880 [Gammaproteobacteria bacterium]|nr:MAG: hypothetical protein DRR42_19880 [Gammaproteobacteria bacterium]
MKPTVVSLFSGCGGLDYGFHQEGFDLVYACDHDPHAVQIYRNNIDSNSYVRDVTSAQFHDDLDNIGSCDVVLGGFPCQGFSKAGPKKHGDSRNLLYLEMKRAVEKLKPRIFVAENVDGLSQNFGGQFVSQITKDFESLGYKVSTKILEAAHYGVPQHRRRIIFVGTMGADDKSEYFWPQRSHHVPARNGEKNLQVTGDLFGENGSQQALSPAMTIREAIADIQDIELNIPDHVVTNAWNTRTQKVLSKIGEGQKLCNVRFSPTSVYTWQIPEVYGPVDGNDVEVLETIGKNRRHKRYGNIPNGNPLPIAIIEELSGLNDLEDRLNSLVERGYLKHKDDGYDLKGAMFCSGLYKRPLWDQPSPTVLTVFDNPRYFIHPSKNRPFSVRECARIQSFPDNFLFSSSSDSPNIAGDYRLIGNAVPPSLGRHLAWSVKKFLDGKKGHTDENADTGLDCRRTA